MKVVNSDSFLFYPLKP